jgi:hypothetical protein
VWYLQNERHQKHLADFERKRDSGEREEVKRQFEMERRMHPR